MRTRSSLALEGHWAQPLPSVYNGVSPSWHRSKIVLVNSSSRSTQPKTASTKSGTSIWRLGRSSFFSGLSTCFLNSDESSKPPVVKRQGVCWNDDGNDGRDGGGVIGRGVGLVSATRSNTAVHICASVAASVRRSLMSGATCLACSWFEESRA